MSATTRPLTLFTFYGPIVLFIGIWWWLAFASTPPLPEAATSGTAPATPQQTPLPLVELTPLSRERIHAALSGDVEAMIAQMTEWDTDAALIEQRYPCQAVRLAADKMLRAQLLARLLLRADDVELERIRREQLPKTLSDDNEVPLPVYEKVPRVLPQTYAAASMLLALTEPEHIIALPKGLRRQTPLHPQHLVDAIPLDAHRYNGELLQQLHPDIAFVAHYSLPATVAALRAQGIHVFTLNNVETLPQILGSLYRVGVAVGRPLKGELMSIFGEAALNAIDNHYLAYQNEKLETTKILFVNYSTHFSMPTMRTLTGQRLTRLGILLPNILTEENSQQRWRIPIDYEQLVALAPDCLIIGTCFPEELHQKILSTPALQKLPAVKEGRLFFVDAEIQDSPSQYAVLAYYDIFAAITASRKES